ncbi:MAG: hypothetical protein ABI591_06250 [Kofleriaceae bacterium]
MRLIGVAAVIGIAGAIATVIGFATEPTQASFSYLTAWLFAFGIAIGALVMLMIAHATGARWATMFRRFLEAIVGTLPVLAILFVPIALSVHRLYLWVDPPATLAPDALAKLVHKAPYLNVSFWTIRAAVVLILWSVAGELLVRWAARLRDDEPRYRARLVTLATAGLPAVALTLTFAVFDWLMSLTPLWYSTIFGLLFWSGGFLAALSLVAVIARGARRVPDVAARISPDHTGALGRMMFAFLAFWAYMEFSQGLIIWMANKPDEVPWYVARGAGAWGGVFAVLVIGHFAVPFFALLSRGLKRRSTLLAIAGVWLLAMHYVDTYWLVMPVLHSTFALHWLDLAAPCAVLGTAVALAAMRSRGRAPLPTDDPRFAAALTYKARG